MEVWLMQPQNRDSAEYITRLAWFAARRCRFYGRHEALVEEVWNTNMEVLGKKLWASVHEDWAIDLFRHILFTFDWEDIPVWLWTELWRHQFIVRNVSPEQRSQRAVQSWRLEVYNPFKDEDAEEFETLIKHSQEFMEVMRKKGYGFDDIRNASLQGVLSPAVISMNAETVHHLAVMRGSQELVGEFGGKAAELFQQAMQQTWDLAKGVCPWMFPEVLSRRAK